MEVKELRAAVEAILFACGDAVSASRIAQVVGVTEGEVELICRDISDSLVDSGSGLEIVKTDDRFQLCTRSEYAGYIREILDIRRNTPLSPAAMEVLAVIAYNEPVTKNFIERVRGVDCSGVVSSLVSKELIEEAGRLEVPGRPIVYKTSDLFLRCFGLESLEQLPKLRKETGEADIEGQMYLDELVSKS